MDDDNQAGLNEWLREQQELLAGAAKEFVERDSKLIAGAEKHLIELSALAESYAPDIPQFDPPPYVDPAPNATADEVAHWMIETVRDNGWLSQSQAVANITNRFGKKFVRINKNGNHAIKPEVLTVFRQMTPDIVWARRGFYWRLRRQTDPPKRRRVEE